MVKKAEVIKEFKEVFAISLFFFICFLLFLGLKKAFLAQYHIQYEGLATAAVGALVLGKVVLILDKLWVTRGVDHMPNIYRVFFRSAIYVVGYVLFTYLEHGVIGLIKGIPLMEALAENTHHLMKVEGYSTLGVLFITFLVFNAFWVMRTHFGPEVLFRVYFSRQPEEQQESS